MTDAPLSPSPPPRLDIATFLVASIHDMKNSLSVMASWLETGLRQSTATDSPLHAGTAKALYEAQRINDNLLQLLALYKIDRDYYPFDPAEHNLEEFGRELLDRVDGLGAGRGIVMDLDCPPDLLWWFDHELVFGAVLQALHNALVYTRGRITLGFAVGNGKLEIRVRDDGPGYPGELLASGDAISRGICHASGSTGLGLYYSGVVARLHQNLGRAGFTRLENDPTTGGGVFLLCLP